MIIKSASAKSILNSHKEKTILVSIATNAGNFSASSPVGTSKGKYEKKQYIKSLEEDIKKVKSLSGYFCKERFEAFDDLRRIEDIVDRHIGANTLFAFESAILKAMAKEKNKEIWELINPSAKNFPWLVGNCIGGGMHAKGKRKPDFQEFLLIPDLNSVEKSSEANKKAKKILKEQLEKSDKNFNGKKDEEDAWETSLNEKQVLEILKEFNLPLGVDIAASSFHKRKNYNYKNPILARTSEEQYAYVSNLIKNLNLFYIEDPFHEEDFESFARLLKTFPKKIIVGDDLTVTNFKRTKKAIEIKSISGVIVKPNQTGSLLEVKRVVELAKKSNIKIVFSHRSGETDETILADLAFGFQADFFKCGITGKEREAKIKRLSEIEESLGKKH